MFAKNDAGLIQPERMALPGHSQSARPNGTFSDSAKVLVPKPRRRLLALDRRNCLGQAGSPDLSLSYYRTPSERLLAAELLCTRSQKCFKEASFCAGFCEVLKITTKVNLGEYRPSKHSALLTIVLNCILKTPIHRCVKYRPASP